MIDFLQLIRWKNLLIVGITQLLIALILLYPVLNREGIVPGLSSFELLLLILATMLIGAGGYIINDIYDQEIDRINKPERIIIGKGISVSSAWRIYSLIGVIGLLFVFYICLQIKNWTLLLIYPIAWGLLWGYSHSFKRTPLFGNVIVSLFCALVPGILLVAEWPEINTISGKGGTGFVLILVYILFAFLTTMIREIIKDLEDIEGDKKGGCRTLPIVLGMNATKAIVLVFSVMLLFTLGVFAASLGVQGWKFVFLFTILGIMFPLGFVLFKLARANEATHFAYLSKLMKYIMLAGLLLLIIFRIEVL